MFVKNSIFITLLGISSLLNANILIHPSRSFELSQNIGGPCNAPAPTNFEVVNIGTTWVDLTWLTSNPSDSHRIKTYETISGNLVSNILVPPGLLVQKVVGLQPNVDYYSRVNVVCNNGYDSENYAEVHFITIIAELIVIGKEAAINTVNCTIQSPDYCFFPANGTETIFKVRLRDYPYLSRTFYVRKNPASTVFRTRLTNGNTGETYVIQCDNHNPDWQGESYQIKVNGQQIAAFELVSQESPAYLGLLNCTSLDEDYEIVRMGPNSNPTPNPIAARNSADENWAEPLGIRASPNPFSESLTVYLDAVTTGPVSFKLFNLSGQKVLDHQYPAGAEQYDLNTSHLPSGFYLLRVGAGEELQTLKVVKSE